MSRVLVVDDDPPVRESLTIALHEAGHDIESVGTAGEALESAFRPGNHFDAILLDLRLPDRHGLEVLAELRKRGKETPIIVISADTEMSSTVKAMRDGAFDYVSKPINLDQLERIIASAVRPSEQTDVLALGVSPTAPPEDSSSVEFVGDSAPMREVFKSLGLLAASRATVLIRGESGTGKELAARTLHKYSKAAAHNLPFVAVNCAALPGPLVEAELFGYRRGAFTGAERDREGKLEAAGEGTLFLDEIGEVPLETQVKLLRVLQERKFERLGETDTRPFRARVVAATHRDLEAMVKQGKLREDLYFRLNVATIMLPALRERREDIVLLAERLLGLISRELGRRLDGLSSGALDRLITYDWPGNVRELRNALTRAAVKARGTIITEDALELGHSDALSLDDAGASAEAAAAEASRFPTLDEVEREHIRRALARARGHKGKTCDLLGISRPTLTRKIRRYTLEPT